MADLTKDIESAKEDVRIAKARLKRFKAAQKVIDKSTVEYVITFDPLTNLKDLPEDLFKCEDEPDEIPFAVHYGCCSEGSVVEAMEGYRIQIDGFCDREYVLKGRYIKVKDTYK